MSNQRISSLNSLSASQVINNDLFIIVDRNDPSSPTGRTKNITAGDLVTYVANNITPGNTAEQVVTQSNHPFRVGSVIRMDHDQQIFVTASANSTTGEEAEVVGIVSQVVSTSSFKLTTAGYVNFSEPPYWLPVPNYYVSYSLNLLDNGGFETGDFSSWDTNGNSGNFQITSSGYSSSYALKLSATGSLGFIYQRVPTIPGNPYVLTYFLKSQGTSPSEFQVTVENNVVYDQFDLTSFDYTEFSSSFIANSYSTILQFGVRNDSGSFLLDNVSVSLEEVAGPPTPLALETGTTYFLWSDGTLADTDPSATQYPSWISKPYMVAVGPTTGIITNYRGFYQPTGDTTSVTTLYVTASNSFVVGDAVRKTLTIETSSLGNWTLATADSYPETETIGIVNAASPNYFSVILTGRVGGLNNLEVGETYYLVSRQDINYTSASIGSRNLVSYDQRNCTTYSKPVCVAISTTEAVILNQRASGIDGPSCSNYNPYTFGPMAYPSTTAPTSASIVTFLNTILSNANNNASSNVYWVQPSGSNQEIISFNAFKTEGGWFIQ